MTRIIWDDIESRFYENGLDRGVLYPESAPAVAWNGLTAIDSNMGGEASTPLYFEGQRYLNNRKMGDWEGAIRAFIYPEEFEEIEGQLELELGLMAYNQKPKRFGLCFRTGIGNATERDEFGYQIHLLYNLQPVATDRQYATIGAQTNPDEFTWPVKALPELLEGYRPTAHAFLDTRYLNPFLVADLEDLLYGTSSSDAELPSLQEIHDFIRSWDDILIVDNGDGTWTARGPSSMISMLDADTFQITDIPAVITDYSPYYSEEYFVGDAYEIETTEP